IGPSGCGKSTVLNAVASLIPPDQAEVTGSILVGGEDVVPRAGGKTASGLGYVFQRDSLMPWRTVKGNILAGLEIRKRPRDEREETARDLIMMAGLSGFEDYYPYQISGGMRQRTSLIRTLAYDPDIILMDEPFGALDAQTRMTLQTELIRIWSERKKTILFVTHDLGEAISLGQRVIGFSRQPGQIIRDFKVPFEHPRDPFKLFGSAEFAEYQAEVWREISDEFRGDVAPGARES
ncbi:MAG: ATP-binding cassette domain-containing protein, partial [Nitriliruptorales bacterium]|nr:ATP-binding cassette domain-containing protein [Nitriliruptorales bacterium]